MKRKLLILGLSLLLLASLVAACGAPSTVTVTAPAGAAPTVTVTVTAPAGSPSPTPTSTGVYDLTFAWTNEVPNQMVTEIFRPGGEFQRLLYERSNGRIRLKVVQKMFPTVDNVASVMQGKADMGDLLMPYHSGAYPWWSWAEVPGLVTSDAKEASFEEITVYRDPRMRALWKREHRKLGLEHLLIAQGGSGNLLATKKPINTLADIKGIKSRVYGALAAQGLKALGAATVTMPIAEVETSLMTGVIDAVLSGPLFLNRSGLARTVPYMTFLPMAPVWTDAAVINAQKFDSLPPDLQKVILEVSQIAEYQVTAANSSEINMAVLGIGYAGGKVSRLPQAEWDQALQLVAPIRDDWVKNAGPVGAEILPIAQEVLAKYRAFKPF
ncbi:MAG: TRAP transporter substrate-binding protein DctP [Chloroflexi bacterium]|nr:TRAP transporter substrate-binding protein DctP [Chloroflexota bacterium]